MSQELVKAWFSKYYPVAAASVAPKDSLKHSVRKWKGLQRGVLEKVGAFTGDLALHFKGTGTKLRIDAESCALCAHYLSDGYVSDTWGYKDDPKCPECPIVLVGGQEACCIQANSPFNIFAATGDVAPVLKILQKANRELKYVKATGKWEPK